MTASERKADLRTAYLTHWFLPVPVSVTVGITRALRQRGHTVEVLTSVPYSPEGKAFPGYRAWRPRTEVIEGMTVRRAPLAPSHDSSARRRMVTYLSWALSAAAVGVGTLRRADVALVYSSPATAALPAMIWRRVTGTPYVLLVQDVWPDSVLATGFLRGRNARRIVQAALSRFCAWSYRSAAHIAVISPGAVALLASRGVPSSKISVVYNWTVEAPEEPVDPREARRELGLPQDAFVFSYAGNHGPAQGLDVVIEAAHRNRDLADVHLLMVGDGVAADELRALAASLGVKNITFTGLLPRSSMGTVRAASDVQLVCLADDPLFKVTMPSKVQAILLSGTAALVIGDGDAATAIEESGAGWSVPAGDPDALAEAFRTVRHESLDALRARGAAGRAYYQRTMSETIGGDRLDAILRAAARSCPRRSAEERQ